MKIAPAVLIAGIAGAAQAESCVEKTKHVGECFVVHGRLSYYNGGPSARIWPVGSKRMLGVLDERLPANIAEHMRGFDDQTFADFEVCPLTKQKPGKMQFVCIRSAANPVFKKRGS